MERLTLPDHDTAGARLRLNLPPVLLANRSAQAVSSFGHQMEQ
jgi:hypothetical protein